MAELAAFGHPVKDPKEFTVAEMKVLVRENRMAAGLLNENKGQQDVMSIINQAKLDQLKEMCLERGIPLWEKARVGDLRLHHPERHQKKVFGHTMTPQSSGMMKRHVSRWRLTCHTISACGKGFLETVSLISLVL